MTLGELLGHIDENTHVIIVDANSEFIAEYDGRNSIPFELNDQEVNMIWIENGSLMIGILADYYEFDQFGVPLYLD